MQRSLANTVLTQLLHTATATARSLSITRYSTAVEHIIVGTNGHNYQKLTLTHIHRKTEEERGSTTYAKESKSCHSRIASRLVFI